MKTNIKYKALDFLDLANKLITNEWVIKDLPFEIRKAQNEGAYNKELVPISGEEEDFELILLDKIFLMNKVLKNVNSDILKHVNIFLNANVKDSLCYTDFILIRFNKIFVVEFSYQLVSVVNHNELKEAKIQFFTQQIEQCLKRYLPVDTVVKTFNFVIKDDKYNNGNIERLAQEINNYYEKTTSKELLKILK